MAENKKSFLLYCDIIHTVKKLTDEQAGKLLKHILSYVNDEDPTTDDILLDLVFEPIKQSLKRDLKKYEGMCNRNQINGAKGGRPTKKPKKPTGLKNNPNNPEEPKKPDSDIDSDIDIEIDNDKEKKKVIFKSELDKIIDVWFDYKKERRESYKSEMSKKVCKNKIIELSKGDNEKAKKIIEQSIANNWAGLFALKPEKTNGSEKPNTVTVPY
jgi:hypothetical protein